MLGATRFPLLEVRGRDQERRLCTVGLMLKPLNSQIRKRTPIAMLPLTHCLPRESGVQGKGLLRGA